MEKSKFWVFIFSFLPGAGYMYLDMMKKGVTMMLVFWGFGAISGAMGMSFFIFILPVLWFYTFFDTFHMAKKEYDERIYVDKMFYESVLRLCDGNLAVFLNKKRKWVGVIAIFFSIYAMIYGIVLPIFSWFDWHEFFWPITRIVRLVPTLFVIIFLFLLGKRFLQEEPKEEFTQYEPTTQEDQPQKDYIDLTKKEE